MHLSEAPIIRVKSEGLPKLSSSRNRRLRKKLKVEEFAEHFIDVTFNVAEMLTDEQYSKLMDHPFVTHFTGTSSTLTVSISADTNLMEFYLAIHSSNGSKLVNCHIHNRVNNVAELLGDMTGYRYQSRIGSIHFGDAYYATMDYYNREVDYKD
ncbi:protein of unknown function DUF469 [Vibrio phage 3.058.O._10N.286.46.B8]|nr:protein of unknown function DUF469 [Vibrio phage 2.058.O._10N.286.46.B8]AUS03174.1 protein of unknown function DUF469 [Vibrio phage 3.058.O._10N.286.46.B8]